MKNLDEQELDGTFKRVSERCQSRVNSLSETTLRHYQSDEAGLVVENLDDMARNALCHAIQLCRFKQDYAGAYAFVQRFVRTLKTTLFADVERLAVAHRDRFEFPAKKKVASGFNRSALFHMLQACLFVGDWSAAQRLAELIRTYPLDCYEHPTGISAELIACVIQDDLAAFEARMGAMDSHQGTAFANYPLLYHAALRRDAAAFSQAYALVYEVFKKRAKAKSSTMWAHEYGFSAECNALAVDFQGIAACKVAHQLGMPLPAPTEYVPVEVLGHWVGA